MQVDTPAPIKRRKPLLALLLSCLLPGLGQLYNGEFNKAIWLFLLLSLLGAPAVALLALKLPPQWLLYAGGVYACVGIFLWLYAQVDAFRTARRLSQYTPQVWQRSGVYVLILIMYLGVMTPALTDYVRTHWVESFRVPSGSMEPTVMTGDMLFADKRYNCPGCLSEVKRGDIVIFIHPDRRNQYFIKRVIGLPGEKLQIHGTDIYINGKTLTTAQTQTTNGLQVTETDGKSAWQVVWSNPTLNLPQTAITIPAGQVFVMGDNRSASNDSRFFGTAALRDIVGKARQVWLSVKGNHFRWERMGQLLE